MIHQILQTKLHIPKLSDKLVSRPRLSEPLLAGIEKKITLVSAPAGFGKTTVLSEFVARSPRPTAWLSLDAGDNDPVHFLSYLIAALQTVQPGFGEGIKSAFQAGYPSGSLSMEGILTQLINEVAQLERPLVLVLDDVHTITEAQIHQAMIFLLDHLPSNLHLVIVSRADPPWPLARQRARGEMTELRAADLRFTREEARDFLLEKMDLSLLRDQLEALEARTEGWPAGLQMAAIALQSQDTMQSPAGFIAGFTGSHRFIVDYLTDEVLQRQPEPVPFFLLHTSLLNRMNASLCSALFHEIQAAERWSVEDCQVMLETLESTGLFLVPLDENRHWYRYHHLFADLLRHRLQQKAAHLQAHLHDAASRWYASQAELQQDSSLVEEALQHAYAAQKLSANSGSPASEARLTVLNILDRLGEIFWQQGEQSRLRVWIERLSPEELANSANLNILYAWLLMTGGQYGVAEEALARAEQYFAQRAPGKPPSPDLLGKIAVVRAFLATFTGNFPAIIPSARQALAHLSGSQSNWRTMASSALGDALSLSGDSPAALLAYREACASSRPSENPYLALNAGVKLAMALRQAGQLPQAVETIEQQLETAANTGLQKTAMAGLLMAIKGDIQCEWGEVQKGLALAKEGVQICKQGSHIGYLGWSYLALARIRAAAGDLFGLEAIIQNFDAMQPNLPPWLASPHEALRGLLWLARADFPRLEEWLQQRNLTPEDPQMLLRAFEYLAFARILLAKGQYAEAGDVLRRLRTATISGGQVGPAINALVVESLLYERQGDRPGAAQAIDTALRLAQTGGFLQIFLQEGAALWPVIQSIDSTHLDPAYIDRLIRAFHQTLTLADSPERSQSQEDGPLSGRELEVLRLMAEGHPNRQIADQLHISMNTVLFHSKNIFSKLNTNSRTQAVARARELGIL